MHTHTQYYMKDKPTVEKTIIDLTAAYGMSDQKIQEHFDNVAKQNSYHHNIMIELRLNGIQRMKHETRCDYNKKTGKRIAKRYRVSKRG